MSNLLNTLITHLKAGNQELVKKRIYHLRAQSYERSMDKDEGILQSFYSQSSIGITQL